MRLLLRSGLGAGHMINIARGPQVVIMVPPQPLRRMPQLSVAQEDRRASGGSKGRERVPALASAIQARKQVLNEGRGRIDGIAATATAANRRAERWGLPQH